MIRIVLMSLFAAACAGAAIFPEKEWAEKSPPSAGMHVVRLKQLEHYLGGRGMIVRSGWKVYEWGDVAKRGDIASAAKPLFTHLLFRAVETGRLKTVDTPIAEFEPRLGSINAGLGHKDMRITFRHAGNQTSCYGVSEAPGAAYNYNDWQMALFWDALVEGVWRVQSRNVDDKLFHPLLTDPIRCQDAPTMLAFGPRDRPGRTAISPRDFCRIGLLYLREGRWKNRQLLSKAHVRELTRSALPGSLPQSTGVAAEMLPGQRTIGSTRVPDNQTPHFGCYSWLWWVNNVRPSGTRLWPHAPPDTFCALGHANGLRGLAIIPSWDIVMSWNDTDLGKKPWANPDTDPHPLDQAFQLLKPAGKVTRGK
jgi:CubicO group peptidase (beta-lactamase class C family)